LCMRGVLNMTRSPPPSPASLKSNVVQKKSRVNPGDIQNKLKNYLVEIIGKNMVNNSRNP
jgi:hypothetical protein